MPTESHPESVALRTALRELVALSTIPAAWVGREPPVIAAGLADVLVGSLRLDFAFVRLCDPRGGTAAEGSRGNRWEAFPEWLRTHPGGHHFSCKEIVADIGGAEQCRRWPGRCGMRSHRLSERDRPITALRGCESRRGSVPGCAPAPRTRHEGG